MFTQFYSPWWRTIMLRKRVRASKRKRRRCPTRTPVRTTTTKMEKLEISGNRTICSQGFYLTIVYINELQNRIGPGQLGEVALLLQEHPRQCNPLVEVTKSFCKIPRERWNRRQRGARRESLRQTRQENLSDVTSRTF